MRHSWRAAALPRRRALRAGEKAAARRVPRGRRAAALPATKQSVANGTKRRTRKSQIHHPGGNLSLMNGVRPPVGRSERVGFLFSSSFFPLCERAQEERKWHVGTWYINICSQGQFLVRLSLRLCALYEKKSASTKTPSRCRCFLLLPVLFRFCH